MEVEEVALATVTRPPQDDDEADPVQVEEVALATVTRPPQDDDQPDPVEVEEVAQATVTRPPQDDDEADHAELTDGEATLPQSLRVVSRRSLARPPRPPWRPARPPRPPRRRLPQSLRVVSRRSLARPPRPPRRPARPPSTPTDATSPTPTSLSKHRDDQPEPTDVPSVVAAEATAKRPYEAVRRGWAGWVAVLVALGCAGLIFYLGSEGELEGEPGLAAGIGVVGVLAGLFAYRRIGRSSRVVLTSEGLLTMSFGPNQHQFDLAEPETELEMAGQPGDRTWELRVPREGSTPLVVTSSSVDPVQFTDALKQWRPGL